MAKAKILNRTLKTTFLVTAFLSIGWADTWESLKTATGLVTSVRAEFTQEKHMEILSRPLVSGGVFFFQAPNSLRWEYRHPVRSILLLHNGKTKRFVQKDRGLVEDAAAGLQSMQMVVQEITQWLNGRFDENPAFTATLETGRKIVLTPKEKSLAKLIQRIEINLSERPAVIKSVMIYESRNSYTKLEFKNVTLNQRLEKALFRKA
ncbi:outer membrane lipoprotein carrier protein LolA [Thermodesulfobacteriota bacterium]